MLKTIFANQELANPFMNASGVHCMTIKELEEMNQSSSGAYITKSCTPHYREGNPEPRYIDLPTGSINSMGLPNRGFDYYFTYVKENPADKLRFFSISGMNNQENLTMLHQLQDSSFDGITELNLSCPNVPGKPQLAYDFEQTKELLTDVFAFYKKPLGVKLPPYFDLAHFDQMAQILNQFPIAYVNSINSVGNGLVIDPELEQVVIKPKNGFGGLGGPMIKATALANVYAFSTRLRSDIQIIGTGGIQTGKDAFEHLLCGATVLQVGTQLHQEGTDLFDRLIHELEEVMTEKGYTSIEQFRGKLKSL